MKKFLMVSLMICGFSAQANMGSNSEKGFFSVYFGLDINQEDLTVETPRLGLSYGDPINVQENYFGFFELGIQTPLLLLSFKYGYELMRESPVSFGGEISLSLGLPSYGESNVVVNAVMIDKSKSLGFTNEIGAFIRLKITNSVSTFIRAGVQQIRPFKDISYLIKFSPYVDVGARYKFGS